MGALPMPMGNRSYSKFFGHLRDLVEVPWNALEAPGMPLAVPFELLGGFLRTSLDRLGFLRSLLEIPWDSLGGPLRHLGRPIWVHRGPLGPHGSLSEKPYQKKQSIYMDFKLS